MSAADGKIPLQAGWERALGQHHAVPPFPVRERAGAQLAVGSSACAVSYRWLLSTAIFPDGSLVT